MNSNTHSNSCNNKEEGEDATNCSPNQKQDFWIMYRDNEGNQKTNRLRSELIHKLVCNREAFEALQKTTIFNQHNTNNVAAAPVTNTKKTSHRKEHNDNNKNHVKSVRIVEPPFDFNFNKNNNKIPQKRLKIPNQLKNFLNEVDLPFYFYTPTMRTRCSDPICLGIGLAMQASVNAKNQLIIHMPSAYGYIITRAFFLRLYHWLHSHTQYITYLSIHTKDHTFNLAVNKKTIN